MSDQTKGYIEADWVDVRTLKTVFEMLVDPKGSPIEDLDDYIVWIDTLGVKATGLRFERNTKRMVFTTK